jgi:hypothetical protein
MPAKNDAHESLLEQVRIAHHARVNARTAAEKEARDLIVRRVHDASMLESRAVRTAMAAGISRRRVGMDGLGTSDYHTVTRVLSFTEEEHAQADVKATGDARVRLVQDPAERVTIAPAYDQAVPPRDVPVARIDWTEYPAADGPVDLNGYVRLAEGGDYWTGLTDDNEEPADGALWFEARQTSGILAERLRALLNES